MSPTSDDPFDGRETFLDVVADLAAEARDDRAVWAHQDLDGYLVALWFALGDIGPTSSTVDGEASTNPWLLTARAMQAARFTSAAPATGLEPAPGSSHLRDAVLALRQDLHEPEHEWLNIDLAEYLDGLWPLAYDIEATYPWEGEDVLTDPWVLIADAILGARYYE